MGLALAITAGLVLGLVVLKHKESGEWQAPELDDFVEVVVPDGPPPPSRTIYLDPNPETLTPGLDDAPQLVSGVVHFHHPDGPVKVPGWKGTKKAWGKLVKCVQTMFARFNVLVTDQAPTGSDFIRVVVGGKPGDIGIKDQHTSGMAPFNGEVISKAVVFAFSAHLRNDVRATCETISMEVAHAYGLDHEYLCKDVMTYLSCGNRTFVDQDVPCGEKKKRACKGGAATQNSFRRLLGVLGPAPVPTSGQRP